MTTLTMRLVKGDFIVTGPDIAPMKFKSRPEAGLVHGHHPASSITEIGRAARRGGQNRQSDQAGEDLNCHIRPLETRAPRITHPRPALSLGRASYGHRQGASGGGRGRPNKSPAGGRGTRQKKAPPGSGASQWCR